MKHPKPTISFIIPLKDEAPTLTELHSRITEQCEIHARDWEIIFIDDGSSDDSWNIIQELSQCDPEHVKAIKFRTNRTKAPALATGYAEALGEVVFTLDADLQDDPKEIPRFLEKLNEDKGWDIVSGYKEKRHDPWHKVLPSRIFNKMLSKVNGVQLHDHNCGFKCYRREVVKNLPMYGEMHRMVPSLAAIEGYRTTEIVVEHHARKHGISKYGWERLMRGFLDMWSVFFIRTYRERPLHFAGGVAFFCVLFSVFLWTLSALPFLPTGLKSVCFVMAPASFFVAPLSILIGFLGELISYRHYKDGIDVPIIERIDLSTTQTCPSKVVSLNREKEKLLSDPSLPQILIADDDPVTRSLSERILEAEGWNVISASSGEEAMGLVSSEVHVMLLDIYLPGLSGLEILPKVKLLSPSTQVVVLSGSDKAQDGASAIKAGALDFLSKPVKKTLLTETLKKALNTSKALRPQEAHAI